MSALVAGLEKELGHIRESWADDVDGRKMPYQICEYDHGWGPATAAYSTLGLSQHTLVHPRSGKKLHEELLLLVAEEWRTRKVPAVLHQIASGTLGTHTALVPGDVLGPGGPILPDALMEAFVVAQPVYFPDEFGLQRVGEVDVLVAWLIPVTAEEAAFVRAHGYRRFEELLVDQDPDLQDLRRPPVVLPGA